jgi:hypothetical protein
MDAQNSDAVKPATFMDKFLNSVINILIGITLGVLVWFSH